MSVAGRGVMLWLQKGLLLTLHFLIRGTADWFGVSKESDATQKWQRKSLRHCSLRYGKLKPQALREMDLPSQDNISLASTETPPPLYLPPCPPGMQRVGSLGSHDFGGMEQAASGLTFLGSRWWRRKESTFP